MIRVDLHAAGQGFGAGALLFLGTLPSAVEFEGVRPWLVLVAASIVTMVVMTGLLQWRNDSEILRHSLTALLAQMFSELELDADATLKARLMVFLPNRKRTKVFQAARYTAEGDMTPKRGSWAMGVGIAGTTMAGTKSRVVLDVTKEGGSMEEALRAFGLDSHHFARLRDQNRHCYVAVPVFSQGQKNASAVILLDSVKPEAFDHTHENALVRFRDAVYWVLKGGANA